MAVTASYSSLEPQIISQVTGKPANGKIGQSFFATSEFIYILLFVAIVAAAFYRYALAGIWMMAASEKYMRMSKDEFRRVTLGLLGVFSMFIVIYTFNKDLLLGDVGLAYLKVTGQAAPAITSGRGGDYAGAGATGQGAGPDEATVRAQLVGYSFNNPPCTSTRTSNCTNVGGLDKATISMLQKLRTECVGCVLQITGGTEGGHSANSRHGVGREAVDLSLSPTLETFIKNNGVAAGTMTGCDIRYAWGGFKFWDEKPGCDDKTTVAHFHVSFNGR